MRGHPDWHITSWYVASSLPLTLRCSDILRFLQYSITKKTKLHIATIEALYHAVAILSCRSRTWADPRRSSTSYLRQSLSTLSLSSTVGRELHDQLVLFPFIPYAISLSLSIAYREMRHSKVPLHRARARAQFQTICDMLSGLEGVFWSASTTAEMGRKMIREMDRVFSTVAASESRRPQQDATNVSANIGDVYGFTSISTPGNCEFSLYCYTSRVSRFEPQLIFPKQQERRQ
jgi:hypothetical protein